MTATVPLNDALNPIVEITTGSAPVNIPPTPGSYLITSGGTGGQEIVNIQMPDLPIETTVNPYLVGRRINVILVTQTDPADFILVKVNGLATDIQAKGGGIYFNPQASYVKNLKLLFAGFLVSFEWNGQVWAWDGALNWNLVDAQVQTANALPTADPVIAGAPWNNAGTVKISVG